MRVYFLGPLSVVARARRNGFGDPAITPWRWDVVEDASELSPLHCVQMEIPPEALLPFEVLDGPSIRGCSRSRRFIVPGKVLAGYDVPERTGPGAVDGAA